MSFVADKQTTDDLNLLGKYKPNSIYGLFSKVRTPGGERLLDAMFQQPLTDPVAINRRSSLFRYFQEKELVFPFQPAAFRLAEEYLSGGVAPGLVRSGFSVMRKKAMGIFLRDEQFMVLSAGMQAAIEMLRQLSGLIALIDGEKNPWKQELESVSLVLADTRLEWVRQHEGEPVTTLQLIRYDHLLRHTLRQEMQLVLNAVYEIDVYIAVSATAQESKLDYAMAFPHTRSVLQADALWHPALDKAVANPVHLNSAGNVLFLTGANMAGKSTFMKSLGIAVYLAHMGFPVAARGMQFSVRDGLYSSINVSDNLNMGYSHFYAEVLRVKKAAEEVSSGRNMVVIFDELFKGTNVKDAYDATLSVTASFSRYHNCIFVISTHIIEVGEALASYHNLQFAYMPTVMSGNIPVYPYTLKQGITSDRHGMMIVMNEGILEMIKGN
ncbi:MutS-related protein [Pseudobacter ginsenosidimutans]|uniref:MutS-like protein n=1 Tax=Pseudobacter ginsenosidimutans TaxID=661488 RepID=A0A4Q7MQN5_9BACT|nr:DNA mismatch repair protein [Pseudobacter ginsenosidimutans]QEC42135.1 DNA mismatch repair protein [Pseudobacter ginsenosidimutans]RZS71025.1 MutS-like protein [Pseudobacter ginsenosidimutans]